MLAGQTSLEKRQDKFEADIKQIRSNLDEMRDSSSTDSGTGHKRKRVVIRALSVSFRVHTHD